MIRDALVVGAGIGGLSAALSLDAAGVAVRVVEASPSLRPSGLGINLLPHAVRELAELGLLDELVAAGIETHELVYLDRHGNRIHADPRGRAAGFDWPQVSIRRSAVQAILLEALTDRCGPVVEAGWAAEGVDPVPTRPVVGIRRSDGTTEDLDADLVVGADGLHSVVRAHFHPDEGPPAWSGISMWRGTTVAEPFLTGRSMVMMGSNTDAKFVAYPVAASGADVVVNWVAEVRTGGAPDPARWDRHGRAEDFAGHFEGWRFAGVDVEQLCRRCEEVFAYPMVDRDPIATWGQGAVTLLGDAAHPMYPIGSNGASQAIIDGRVLAWHTADEADAAAAVRAYEARRIPETARVVLDNRAMGPERVLALVAERAPDGFDRIEDVLPAEELDAITASYRQVAGFAVDALNRRPSYSVDAGQEGEAT